jgi:NAD-dependent deacetylase
MPMKIPEEIKDEVVKGADLIKNRLPAMVVTGAGISVESNIPHFRGPGGLWERYDPYEYGHIETFKQNPQRTWKMLKEIIEGSINSRPNEAHFSLSRMESKGWIGPVVTQNVDGLHILAGTKDLLEVHGNARHIYCTGCGRTEILDEGSWETFSIKCLCGVVKRPDIVFFGEQLPQSHIQPAFLLAYQGVNTIVIGTSGVVQPVASLPPTAKANGGHVIEINPLESDLTSYCSDVHIKAPATVGTRALEMALEECFS